MKNETVEIKKQFLEKVQSSSQRIYSVGSSPDIRVPFREVTQSDTVNENELEKNPPVTIYDTSGPFGDEGLGLGISERVDIRKGISPVREKWIDERGDTVKLNSPTSVYSKEQNSTDSVSKFMFTERQFPRVAREKSNVTQLHYARNGVITPEMEFVAIRENLKRQELFQNAGFSEKKILNYLKKIGRYHEGESFGAKIPLEVTPEFVRNELATGRAIIPNNINHPESNTKLLLEEFLRRKIRPRDTFQFFLNNLIFFH
jgi:phosphomethylpyrimidine synthase